MGGEGTQRSDDVHSGEVWCVVMFNKQVGAVSELPLPQSGQHSTIQLDYGIYRHTLQQLLPLFYGSPCLIKKCPTRHGLFGLWCFSRCQTSTSVESCNEGGCQCTMNLQSFRRLRIKEGYFTAEKNLDAGAEEAGIYPREPLTLVPGGSVLDVPLHTLLVFHHDYPKHYLLLLFINRYHYMHSCLSTVKCAYLAH
jgi:hypothetical protein